MTKNKEDPLEVTGIVREALKGKFRVEVSFEGTDKTTQVMAHLSGKMRKFYIRIVPGDTVKVELSPYDLTRGRIVYREK